MSRLFDLAQEAEFGITVKMTMACVPMEHVDLFHTFLVVIIAEYPT